MTVVVGGRTISLCSVYCSGRRPLKWTSYGVRHFSSFPPPGVPFKQELVDLLRRANYEQVGANQIIDAVDAAVIQGISRHTHRFMSLDEYEKVLRTVQEGVEAHRKEMQQSEVTTAAALATDYDFVLGEVNRTRQRIKEEAQQLESNVQLDLNLERKRRTDLLADVEGKGTVAGGFLERRAGEIEERLQAVAKQAMRAIIALGISMLGGFVGYKFYLSC